MESTTSTGVRPSGLQPKFKDCSFDSDKNPGYFLVWIKLISGIVRNLPGGAELEAFLDCYLLRHLVTVSTRPSFLSDPRLQIPDLVTTSGPETNASASGDTGDGESVSLSGGASEEVTMVAGPTEYHNYMDLPKESRTLDATLFHTLYTIVTGKYLTLIMDLTGEASRYTYAIIAMLLYHHQ